MEDPNFNLLAHLGFTEPQIAEANRYVAGTLTIEGAPHLKEKHYAVFDCANRAGTLGKRVPDYHTSSSIDMLAAVSSLVSGAISKTINLPMTATIDEVKAALELAWSKMVKAVSIYRDGSKLSQPLSSQISAALFGDLEKAR